MKLRLALLSACLCSAAAAAPPYEGTVFIDPDMVVATDASSFGGLVPRGTGTRTMFDRRLNAFASFNAQLFDARYDDGETIEVQVNPEFDPTEAHIVAGFYAHAIGQIPAALRTQVETVWIHKGDEVFGGGNQNLLIHIGSIAAQYIRDGFLEEVLLHEAAHTSLDPQHAAAAGWLAAQRADPESISTYARDNPTREDVAESFGPWFAVRARPERISAQMKAQIEAAIPARLAYLDALALDLRPTIFEARQNDQAWITGLGSFSGNTLRIDEAATAHGGEFGSGFDPARVRQPRWGSFTIRFTSCSRAELSYASDDARFGSGGYALERVPTAAQRDCEAIGFANTTDHAWTVGAWFGGAERSGEGVLIDVVEGDLPFAAWFTYGSAR